MPVYLRCHTRFATYFQTQNLYMFLGILLQYSMGADVELELESNIRKKEI